MEKYNKDEDKTLIIGDSAKTNQIDRDLLSGFPSAVSVNVGRYSQTIGQKNRNITQVSGGIDKTHSYLKMVKDTGGISIDTLDIPNGVTVGESHLGEDMLKRKETMINYSNYKDIGENI